MPSLNGLLGLFGIEPRAGANLHGFLLVAILLGVFYYYLVNKSRFGYDLRASGINPSAASASGVNPNRMIVRTMMISGSLAGLVGMSQLLGFFNQYPQDFPRNYGFNGIAVAILGPADAALIGGRGVRVVGSIDRWAAVLQGERLSGATVVCELAQFRIHPLAVGPAAGAGIVAAQVVALRDEVAPAV